MAADVRRARSAASGRGARVAFTVTVTNVQLFDQMTNRADADLRANKVVRCGIDVERCLAEQRLHSLYGRERRRQMSARMLVSPSPTSDMHVVQTLHAAGPTHTHTDGAVPKTWTGEVCAGPADDVGAFDCCVEEHRRRLRGCQRWRQPLSVGVDDFAILHRYVDQQSITIGRR